MVKSYYPIFIVHAFLMVVSYSKKKFSHIQLYVYNLYIYTIENCFEFLFKKVNVVYVITHNSGPQLLSTMGTRLNTGSLRDQIYRRIGIKLVDAWKKHIYKYKNFASEATEIVFTYHNVKQIFTQRFLSLLFLFCFISDFSYALWKMK